MPEPPEARLPTILDAPLARLEESREALAKAWLLRLSERSSLAEIERLGSEGQVRELPAMVSEVIRAAAAPAPGGEASAAAGERAARLIRARRAERASGSELARDLASLQSLMIGALRNELAQLDPTMYLAAVERLNAAFGAVQATAVERLLEHRSRHFERLANTDALTGLHNLRYLHEQLDHLLDLHKRYGDPFGLLLIDVDGLKRINDAHGHAVGDRALIEVANAVRETLRTVDTAVRMGGDEFCVLAPHQTAPSAKLLANRVSLAIDHVEGRAERVAVAVSIGVVACPQHGTEAEPLLELADRAMYQAKAAGERVIVWASNGSAPPNPGEMQIEASRIGDPATGPG